MTSRRLILSLLLWLCALAAACGGGVSTEEATEECNRLRSVDTCFSAPGAFEQCVACHEDCGRDCTLVDSTPCSFTCD